MSKLGRILTMAAISMAAAQQGMTHLPDLEERPQVRRKGEAPKCKTCVHFKTRTTCLSPMKMACEDYKRKKKKR